MTEQQAHDEVLRLCRKTPMGGWIMRQAHYEPPRCKVFNLSPVAVRPHRKIVAQGETWTEVLAQLQEIPTCKQN